MRLRVSAYAYPNASGMTMAVAATATARPGQDRGVAAIASQPPGPVTAGRPAAFCPRASFGLSAGPTARVETADAGASRRSTVCARFKPAATSTAACTGDDEPGVSNQTRRVRRGPDIRGAAPAASSRAAAVEAPIAPFSFGLAFAADLDVEGLAGGNAQIGNHFSSSAAFRGCRIPPGAPDRHHVDARDAGRDGERLLATRVEIGHRRRLGRGGGCREDRRKAGSENR